MWASSFSRLASTPLLHPQPLHAGASSGKMPQTAETKNPTGSLSLRTSGTAGLGAWLHPLSSALLGKLLWTCMSSWWHFFRGRSSVQRSGISCLMCLLSSSHEGFSACIKGESHRWTPRGLNAFCAPLVPLRPLP